MGRNSEGELLLVTAGPVGGQGLASSAHCMGRQETSHSPRWQCPGRLQMDVELNSTRGPGKAGGTVPPWEQS